MAGSEVDFILYGGNTFSAIEVKNARTLNPVDFNGLTSFGDDYPEARLVLVYRGPLRLKNKGIDVIPVGEFLADPGEFLR